MGAKHGELVNTILINLSKDFPQSIRAWSQNTGAVKLENRFVRFGVAGQTDISGIIKGGYRLEIEVKVGKDRQREAQKNFEQMITKFGGVYILARDYKNDVKKTVKKFIEARRLGLLYPKDYVDVNLYRH